MPAVNHNGVDTSLYTSSQAYGDTTTPHNSRLFTDIRGSSGATITHISAYTDKSQLVGLMYTFSDGPSYTHGRAMHRESKFKFQPGETLVNLRMFDSHKKYEHHQYHSGGFEFTTNLGRTFKVKPKKSPHTAYDIYVGSGVLCGAFGLCATNAGTIFNLGFAVLRPVTSAVLLDVQYPGLETLPVATTPTAVDSITYTNNTSSPQTIHLAGSTTTENEKSWSLETSMEFSFTSTVKAGVPVVASVEETFEWKVGQTGIYSRSSKQSVSSSYDFPVQCCPNTRTTAQAIIYQDKISINYEGTMTYNLDSGKTLVYPIQGTYNGLSARGVYVDVQETPLSRL